MQHLNVFYSGYSNAYIEKITFTISVHGNKKVALYIIKRYGRILMKCGIINVNAVFFIFNAHVSIVKNKFCAHRINSLILGIRKIAILPA